MYNTQMAAIECIICKSEAITVQVFVKIKEGVPQGGVIYTTLFILYINDIAQKLTRQINITLHADDLEI
jgi:hypothetical protein